MRSRVAASSLALVLAATTAAHADAVSLVEIKEAFEALDRWQIDKARLVAERTYAQSPEHPLVLALVADVKLHMSDYPGAVAFFAKAKSAGAPPPVMQNAPLAEAARVATQGYSESVSDNFIIRHAPGKDAILVPFAIETLEATIERVGELLGWRPSSRIVVEFYPTAATLAAVSTLTEDEIKNSGTIALCKWNRLMVTSPRAVVFGYGWRDTIAHELVHLIIGGASRNSVPIWLHEGIAKFAETAWRAEPGLSLSVDQQRALRKAAKAKKLIPFEKMHPSMAKLKTQEETSLAFAEVFTFIEYLIERRGWEAMRRVLRQMGQGASDAQAIETVHGEPMKGLAKRWMAGLARREIKRDASGRAVSREVVLKDRPDAPDDKLRGVSKKGRRFARAADLLYARSRLKAAQRELEKAYAETQSPMISAKLASVAMATGDLPGAEAAARQAIAGVPDLPGPNVTLAEILVRQGKLDEAKKPLEAALAINPFDPRIHALRLATLGEGASTEDRARAQLAMGMLTGGRRPRLPPLGTGGLIEIEGLPFSRVFIEKEGRQLIPTGLVTPTSPLGIRPGPVQLQLVPPVGSAVTRTITVTPVPASGQPQRIAPAPPGS